MYACRASIWLVHEPVSVSVKQLLPSNTPETDQQSHQTPAHACILLFFGHSFIRSIVQPLLRASSLVLLSHCDLSLSVAPRQYCAAEQLRPNMSSQIDSLLNEHLQRENTDSPDLAAAGAATMLLPW